MSGSMAFNENNSLIVFVHGLLGFDTIRCLGLSLQYYRKMGQHPSLSGLPVFYPQLPPVGTIEERAKHLADLLDSYHAENIYLIAHSMGGLDCRYFIHHHDPERRVRALVTVGTPHRGTPLADWFLHESSLFARFGRVIGNPGLNYLTPDACSRFNKLVPDRSDVRYVSFAGCRPVYEIPLLLRCWASYVQNKEGDNDGQVSVESAAWGSFQGVVRADHFEQVGWSFAFTNRKFDRPFDHLSFYKKILSDLQIG